MTFSFLPNIRKGRGHIASGIFRALTFSLLLAALACIPAVADPVVQITACGTVITQPGHYILANDLSCSSGPASPISGASLLSAWGPLQNPMDGSSVVMPNAPFSGDGIDIESDHVDLSLNGHTLDGGGSGGAGIAVGVGTTPGNAHVHITGPGTITNFGIGVLFLQASFSSVSEVTVTNAFIGFLIESPNPGCTPACDSTKNDIQGNTATGAFAGIALFGASDNTVRDNTVSNGEFGIVLVDLTVGNDIRANTATGNFVGILLGFFGSGVTDNDVTHNTAQGNFDVDLADSNPNCDNNTWKHNTFGSASPSSCIN